MLHTLHIRIFYSALHFRDETNNNTGTDAPKRSFVFDIKA